MPKKVTRKSPADLVGGATPKKCKLSWFDQLPPEDKAYVREVVEIMASEPVAALSTVAERLIEELEIDRGNEAVRIILKEMIRDAQKTAK